jgi:serine/threonine protein phosphatase PrpC
LKISSGARTDIGRGRSGNEDSYVEDPDQGLYAVADGMGGHRAGEVASAVAVESLKAAYGAGASIEEAVGEANAAVFSKASGDPALRGMGTTLTAVALVDGRAILGHVGDSRAYLMRDGDVTRVTEDHSLVEQLVREGRLSPEEAAHHPQRAIITRALGMDPEVEVDRYEVDLRPGDRLLICSDGLTNMVSEPGIAGVLRNQSDAQRAADTLVDMANKAGGDDNITVVVIDVLGDPAGAAPAAEAQEEPTGEWEFDAASPAKTGPPAAAPRRRRRPGTHRLLAWALPVLLLMGAGVAAVGWYARNTYYVGFSGDRVTVFRGVPGGLLGWDPTVERKSRLVAGELTPAERADLEDGHRFASEKKANRFVARLEEAHPPPPPPPPPTPPGETPTTTPGTFLTDRSGVRQGPP